MPQTAPEAAASEHDGRMDTCCAATRSYIECLGVGDVRRSKPSLMEHDGKARKKVLPGANNKR